MRSPRRRTTGLLLALMAVVAACGVPTDDEPLALNNELPTVVPATPTPQPPDTRDFPVYLVDGEGRMQQTLRELPQPVTITAVVTELTEEPTADEGERGWRSVVPTETTFVPETEDNINPLLNETTAELDFVSGSLDTLERDDLTLALAQIVWTLTESGSVDQVIIRIDSEDTAWPTDEDDSPPGAPLRFEDYDEFSPDFVAPTPTPGAEEPPVEDEPGSSSEPPEGTEPTPTPG